MPVIEKSNSSLQIIAIITDVTEKMVASERESTLSELLSKKEKFLNETQRVSRNGTWEIDLKTNQVLWSDVMREIHEIDSDFELNFETAFNFYKDEESREKLLSVVREAIANGSVFDIESQIVTHKSNTKWIRSTGKADLADGACFRLYGTAQDITHKKKTERALMDAHDKYHSLIQSIDGIVWKADAQSFEFNFVSDKVKDILGYTPEEWMSDPNFWSDHIYDEDREQTVNYCIDHTKQAINHTFDYRMVKADGGIVWIKDVVSVITKNGKPSIICGVMVDITATKLLTELDYLEKYVLKMNAQKSTETEVVLKEYVKGLEKLFPNMHCSIMRVRDNKIYNWASVSLPESYISSINGIEIGPNAGSCGTAAYLKEKVIISDIEADPRCKDYKYLVEPYQFYSCWSYPVLDAEGEAIAVLGIYYNFIKTPDVNEGEVLERAVSILTVILEGRLNMERIYESNLLIAQAQELANFGNWQWDIMKNEVTWSDTLYKIYGLDKLNFAATFEGYLSLLHPDDKERVVNIIQNVLKTHKDILFEEKIIRSDGEERTLKSWGRVILNEEGMAIKMIGACLDITIAKARETQLKEIAWMQSHVIRAPLVRLIGLVDILQNDLSENSEYDELLNHIVHTANELDDVIKNISHKTLE